MYDIALIPPVPLCADMRVALYLVRPSTDRVYPLTPESVQETATSLEIKGRIMGERQRTEFAVEYVVKVDVTTKPIRWAYIRLLLPANAVPIPDIGDLVARRFPVGDLMRLEAAHAEERSQAREIIYETPRPAAPEIPFSSGPTTVLSSGLKKTWRRKGAPTLLPAPAHGLPHRGTTSMTLQDTLHGASSGPADPILGPVIDWDGTRLWGNEFFPLDSGVHGADLHGRDALSFVPVERLEHPGQPLVENIPKRRRVDGSSPKDAVAVATPSYYAWPAYDTLHTPRASRPWRSWDILVQQLGLGAMLLDDSWGLLPYSGVSRTQTEKDTAGGQSRFSVNVDAWDWQRV